MKIETGPFAGLEKHGYGVVLADPPWAFKVRSRKNIGKMPDAHYTCMRLADIQALPVRDLADPKGCALLMWGTAPMLPQAFATMQAWGFEFKTAGAWAKQSKTGKKWAFGTGYCYRSATEFFLLGTIGRPRQQSKSVRNLIVAPVREHSRKPDQMRADLQALFAGPYIDLFARQTDPNWKVWGNETDKFFAREQTNA
jgi:N6-adenosine-specific RNA methylase IME4